MLTSSYNTGLVALSVIVASCSAYVALDLAGRVAATRGRARKPWLICGAVSMGTGIWSMHYIAMLAFTLSVPVLYDIPTVVLSLIAATFASGVALFVVSRPRMNVAALLAGAVSMGGAIAAMHYIGMAAMRFRGMSHWNPRIIVLSVVIAVAVSLVALLLAFHLRSEQRALAPRKLASAAVMGLAVAGMHYTGMAAASFVAHDAMPDAPHAVEVSALGVLAISLVTFMVLALPVIWSIADRRLAAHEAAARASDDRYRLLFNRSLAGVYQCTLDGRIIDCNEAFARLLGYPSREACVDRSVYGHYFSLDDRDHFIEELVRNKSLPDFESRLKRVDASVIWVVENATLVEGSAQLPTIVEGTVVDITRRKDAEGRLASVATDLIASRERYRMLVESTHAVPWEMDGDTLEMTYMSPQTATLFDYDADTIVRDGKTWEVLHEDDRERVRQEFEAFAQSADPAGLDTSFRLLTGSGAVAFVRSIVGADKESTGKVTLRGITFDVTEQRRLEMELQQAQKLESVGRLAAGVAHEINTPVQFVSDSVHFVSFGVDDLTRLIHDYRALLQVQDVATLEQAQTRIRDAENAADLEYLLDNLPKALNRALEGLERVATIVRSMKEFAHPDSRDMAPFDINRAVQNTLTVARNEYKYVAEVDTVLGDIPMVTCHGGEVNQAVLNIVVNAAHAIEEHVRGTTDKGHIVVRTSRDGDCVVIDISDSGGGIPEGVRARIFDPFFTTKEVGKGTGQGLAIARSVIVDKHGGDISFATQTGVGTTFSIRLPIENKQALEVAA